MIIDGKHINVGPRMDSGPKPFKPENAVGKLSYDKDTGIYTVTINDKVNPEFYITLIINQDELDTAKQK